MKLVREGRDLRVDFFRGIALWFIFIDHVPGNFLGALTIRNATLSDATEIFVMLAGYAAGLAYGRNYERYGWLHAGADVLRRTWTLWVAHIFLFVAFAAEVGFATRHFGKRAYLAEVGFDHLVKAPHRALLDALLLIYQPAYLNVLPMYIAILLFFAAALPLLRRPHALLALSLALYAAARIFWLNLPTWRGGVWFFNPLTWQFLFVLGVLLARNPPAFPARPRRLDALAVVLLVLGFAMLLFTWHRPDLRPLVPKPLLHVLLGIDKSALHPFRLVSVLCLVWLAIRLVPAHAGWLRHSAARLFILIGQFGLPVFCFGIFFSFLGRLVVEFAPGFGVQLVVNLVGLAGLAAVAAVPAWYRAKEQQKRAAAAT